LLVHNLNRKQITNTLFYARLLTGLNAKRIPQFEHEDTFIELMIEPKWLRIPMIFYLHVNVTVENMFIVFHGIWQKPITGPYTGKFDVDRTGFQLTRKNGWLYLFASPETCLSATYSEHGL